MSNSVNKLHFVWPYTQFTIAGTFGQIICASSFTLVYVSRKLFVKDAGLTKMPYVN